ncbi:MAG: GTP 3',8-cyclase MoaA [Myxococcota bacterium]
MLAVSCDTDVDARVSDPVRLAGLGTRGVPGWLADRQGRRLRYLRLSVTDRCDLRCRYCMPEGGVPPSTKEDVLTFEEIVRVVRVFRGMGVSTVRLTGGEPLVRKNLTDLVRKLRDEAGMVDVAMTTNATALRKHAPALKAAGLRRINVSLDSIRPETFRHMTRGGDVRRVMDGLVAASEVGFDEIKINAVVVRGMNDHQLGEIVDWAWARGIVPRFIELMPIGEGARLGRRAVVPVTEMMARLGSRLLPSAPEHRLDRGPAGYLKAADDSDRKVGFIGAVTDNFCHRCNRVRVTARGEVRACLASPDGFSFRDALRAGASDADVETAVEHALFGKREGHGFYVDGVRRHHAVNMSQTGG